MTVFSKLKANKGIVLMQMRTKMFIRLTCLSCFSALAGQVELGGLMSSDNSVRDAASKAIFEHYQSNISLLIQIVECGEANIYAKEKAINLLGQLRAVDAVDPLLNNLLFETFPVEDTVTTVAESPSPKALIRIGLPSVRHILESKRIDNVCDKMTLQCYARIIREVMGEDIAKTVLNSYKNSKYVTAIKISNIDTMLEMLD